MPTEIPIGYALDAMTARVRPEVSLGSRTETEGGRLDILVSDKWGKQIAIENKIYAKEQDNWVRRYRNGIPENAPLLYLTLYGSPPLKIDVGMEKNVRCISYATHMVQWLEACRKEVASVPVVRETLTQYLHLIKRLTHQNASSRMNDAIIKSVLASQQDFQAYLALRNAESSIKGRIVMELCVRVRQLVPGDIDSVEMPQGKGVKDEGFYFSTSALRALNLKAGIEFQAASYEKCFYGFKWINREQRLSKSSNFCGILNNHFKEKFDVGDSDDSWPVWQRWTERERWDDDVLQIIQFNHEEFDQEFLKIVESLFEVANLFCEKVSRTPMLNH